MIKTLFQTTSLLTLLIFFMPASSVLSQVKEKKILSEKIDHSIQNHSQHHIPLASMNNQLNYTDALRACYRLSGPGSTGTAVLLRDKNRTGAGEKIILVTSGHVLERMTGHFATLSLRKKKEKKKRGDEGWERVNKKIRIRRIDKSLWVKHPEEDLIVMFLSDKFLDGIDFPIQTLPLSCVATKKDWIESAVEPGDLVRCIGYPHAAQVDTSPAGFPLLRVGSLASYPLIDAPKVLVDYNCFEGDSGGAIVYKQTNKQGESKIYLLGIVQGQHFIDERYKLIYQSGFIRKRLGLSITINSQLVLETIDKLYETAGKKNSLFK